MCGSETLEERHGEYRLDPPPEISGGVIVIRDAQWLSCGNCGEDILPHELTEAIEAQRYKRLELLTPEEVRQVRQRTGLSAVEMGHMLGVGEKTYTRWETGRSVQNKANDLLIRLLDANAETLAMVQAARQPNREATISQYIQELKHIKGNNALAMASHGGDLGEAVTEALRKRLQALVEARKQPE
jgi:putative zinc finger/helix-turn-helix YgiT family protein